MIDDGSHCPGQISSCQLLSPEHDWIPHPIGSACRVKDQRGTITQYLQDERGNLQYCFKAVGEEVHADGVWVKDQDVHPIPVCQLTTEVTSTEASYSMAYAAALPRFREWSVELDLPLGLEVKNGEICGIDADGGCAAYNATAIGKTNPILVSCHISYVADLEGFIRRYEGDAEFVRSISSMNVPSLILTFVNPAIEAEPTEEGLDQYAQANLPPVWLNPDENVPDAARCTNLKRFTVKLATPAGLSMTRGFITDIAPLASAANFNSSPIGQRNPILVGMQVTHCARERMPMVLVREPDNLMRYLGGAKVIYLTLEHTDN